MTALAIARNNGFDPLARALFATLAYGLGALIAAPFFAVLLAPFYMGAV